MEKSVKVVVTLGPATKTEEHLRKIKDKGVDFVRINMSHSSIEDLRYFINLAKKVGIPFIIDTEGSQVRTGNLTKESISYEEGMDVRIDASGIGNEQQICLKPAHVISQLEKGDLIHVDFDTLILSILDISTVSQGYITARVITGGSLGRNKAVVIDSGSGKKISLPALSEKDYQSIALGISESIGHIAASFIRSGKAVDEVRRATQNTMKIISKIECIEALEHLDEVIRKSDYLLIDRGDLSKEIPIEKVPFTQKMILQRAQRYHVGVFVATNLLETMITKKKPTRAEVHDIITTILDGAAGLTLAGETAIGNYPMECINMLNKLISHTQQVVDVSQFKDKETKFVQTLENKNYLLDMQISSSLIPPHGGVLVNRLTHNQYDDSYLRSLPAINLTPTQEMDVEQIAVGTYSPIEGFMGSADLQSVLETLKLSSGIVWSMPIILDVAQAKANELSKDKDVALYNSFGQPMAILHLEEIYPFNKEDFISKMYGTQSTEHPGVRWVQSLQPVLLAGKIDLLQRRDSDAKEYELTPKQVRRLFEERGWTKVVGFHTRNVIHRSHEFIQRAALVREHCDGLFVHPIVGKKKAGDFEAKYIVRSYELMMKHFYPKNSAVFATFASYSRYAGPREALFTALCRKNFGCSHFIVGRDHTGVGNFYHPNASHTIFDRFPEIGIKAVKFNNIFYSPVRNDHLEEDEESTIPEMEKLHLSGTQARKLFEQGKMPPEWFMRPQISQMIVDAIKNGEDVFVKE